jgi:hypothetical protein
MVVSLGKKASPELSSNPDARLQTNNVIALTAATKREREREREYGVGMC